MKTLRVILQDHLSHDISSLSDLNPNVDVIAFFETMEECTYVKHHQKKLVFLLSAMRHFAEELKEKGYEVEYITLNNPKNTGSLTQEVMRQYEKHKPENIVVTWPGEYRIYKALTSLNKHLLFPIEIREDDRFFATQKEFEKWARPKKELRMEFFYREMRQKHQILMEGKDPIGGKWNYDAENRKFPKTTLNIPTTYETPPDKITEEVKKVVKSHFSDHFGDIEPFFFAVTREQALKALHKFIHERLSNFGDYQDAMIQNEPWMYHSHLSFYINCGLLNPKECVKMAEQAFHAKIASLNAVEGFIRQILGWREYVRGLYWLKMPQYKELNFFKAKRPLPAFYWTTDTRMNCLKQCISETKENAYAHHIQRLMVLGNFALIAGIDPDEVNEWYLIVYADAFEWVELPNVTGMILFADGGYLASKPYAASGAYINKMSNYCENCTYKVTKKNGPDACPFNYLYWDFLIRHREKLEGNHRLSMMYAALDKLDEKRIKEIEKDSKDFFSYLSQLKY